MKGKLIKCSHFCALQIESDIIAVSLNKESESHTVNYEYSLSKRNCEAIQNGYDLDELADEYYKQFDNLPIIRYNAYTAGFQKALSILGDKKFNQNDVLDVVNHVLHEMVLFEGFDKQYLFPESVYHEATTKCQSIQQKEWDVEILMEKMNLDEIREQGKGFLNASIEKPKLDENGCLILKKVK